MTRFRTGLAALLLSAQAAMAQQPVQAARPLIDDDSSEESEQSLLDQLAEENTEKGYVSDIDRLMRHLQ